MYVMRSRAYFIKDAYMYFMKALKQKNPTCRQQLI